MHEHMHTEREQHSRLATGPGWGLVVDNDKQRKSKREVDRSCYKVKMDSVMKKKPWLDRG